MCHMEGWLTRLGWQNFDFVFDTKTKKMRPCRSEAKQLRCICSSCACETAKAFSQDSSDPLGPRDGLRPGGIDTRFWLDAALLPGGTWPLAGASKKTALRLTARLTQSFWVEHMVSLRALSFCDDQPCRRRGGEGVGWGQASLPGSLPQASSRTEACHTHRGGPTLLPRFRKRASVGTDAGAVAPVAPVRLAKQKKRCRPGRLGIGFWCARS